MHLKCKLIWQTRKGKASMILIRLSGCQARAKNSETDELQNWIASTTSNNSDGRPCYCTNWLISLLQTLLLLLPWSMPQCKRKAKAWRREMQNKICNRLTENINKRSRLTLPKFARDFCDLTCGYYWLLNIGMSGLKSAKYVGCYDSESSQPAFL